MAVSAFRLREEHQVLEALARRAGDDLDAALEEVLLVEQPHLRLAAAEELDEGRGEMPVDLGERLREAGHGGLVDLPDRAAQALHRARHVRPLRAQEALALLLLGVLLGGEDVDRTHRLEQRAEAFDLGPQLGEVGRDLARDLGQRLPELLPVARVEVANRARGDRARRGTPPGAPLLFRRALQLRELLSRRRSRRGRSRGLLAGLRSPFPLLPGDGGGELPFGRGRGGGELGEAVIDLGGLLPPAGALGCEVPRLLPEPGGLEVEGAEAFAEDLELSALAGAARTPVFPRLASRRDLLLAASKARSRTAWAAVASASSRESSGTFLDRWRLPRARRPRLPPRRAPFRTGAPDGRLLAPGAGHGESLAYGRQLVALRQRLRRRGAGRDRSSSSRGPPAASFRAGRGGLEIGESLVRREGRLSAVADRRSRRSLAEAVRGGRFRDDAGESTAARVRHKGGRQAGGDRRRRPTASGAGQGSPDGGRRAGSPGSPEPPVGTMGAVVAGRRERLGHRDDRPPDGRSTASTSREVA